MPTLVHKQYIVMYSNAHAPAEARAGRTLSPSISEIHAVTQRPHSLPASRKEGVQFFRGSLLGIALEAGAALCAYGLWQAWHFLR